MIALVSFCILKCHGFPEDWPTPVLQSTLCWSPLCLIHPVNSIWFHFFTPTNKIMTEFIIAVSQASSTRAAEGTWARKDIPRPISFPLLFWALNTAQWALPCSYKYTGSHLTLAVTSAKIILLWNWQGHNRITCPPPAAVWRSAGTNVLRLALKVQLHDGLMQS